MTADSEKVLLFAGVPHRYLDEWQITSDLSVASEKLGVEFAEFPLDRLEEAYNEVGETGAECASALARELRIGAGKRERSRQPPQSEIVKATRLYVAVRGIVADCKADAIGFNCGPWREDSEHPVPCVPLTLLQDEGIPAACQGDIDALLTMLLFRRASGQPSFMGGAFAEDGYLAVSHCVLSRKMGGPDGPSQPYYLADYHGDLDSPTIHTTLAKGQPVTIGRLTQDLQGLIITTGTVADSRDMQKCCRNTLLIDVDDVSGVLDVIRGIQYHLVVAAGRHEKQMERMAREAGIEVMCV